MDRNNAALAGLARNTLFAAVLVAMSGCQSKQEDPPAEPLQPQMTLPVAPGATPPTTGAPPAQPPAQPPTGVGATPPATPPNTTPPPGGDVPPVTMPQAGSAAPPTEPTAGSMAEPPPQMPTVPEVTPPPPVDHGKGDGKDVITIGDSWMTMYGGGIEGGLDRAGTRYRHFGVAATTLINGDIPRQYDRSKSGGAAKTVIMTGGGNDIMFSGGCNTAEACEQSVMRINTALNELWTKMSADGVQDVIYVQYSRDAGTAPTGTRPTMPPPPPAICVSGPIRCHTLATTDLVMGQLPDGIHPSGAAHDRIAKALVALMEEKGMRR